MKWRRNLELEVNKQRLAEKESVWRRNSESKNNRTWKEEWRGKRNNKGKNERSKERNIKWKKKKTKNKWVRRIKGRRMKEGRKEK